MKKIFYKKLLSLILAIVILIIIFRGYIKIINNYRNDRIFALESEKYAEEANNPVFKVDKIMIYSGANVDDLSESQDLSRVNVTQFTDFAVYIDNLVKDEKLSEENTINKIFISNIGISANGDSGIRKFSSKKIDDLGKYIPIDKTSKEIDYNVIHKNEDKDKVDNSKSFFTDCSEPLIISYVNENIVQAVDASSSGERLSLDGSILKHLNIDLEQLNYKINFTINIENNLGEQFACNCTLNVDLSLGDGQGIYSGYIMQIFDLSKGDFRFKKLNK